MRAVLYGHVAIAFGRASVGRGRRSTSADQTGGLAGVGVCAETGQQVISGRRLIVAAIVFFVVFCRCEGKMRWFQRIDRLADLPSAMT